MPATPKHGFLKSLATATGRAAGTVVGIAHSGVSEHRETTLEREDVRFERSDINTRATFLTGAGILIGMWLTIGLLYFYFTGLARYRAAVSPPPLPAELRQDKLPPKPRLQGSPRLDLKAFRARENWELTHYHWLDKSHGVVAIPIEDAIRITVQRGIAPSHGAPNATLTPPAEGTRETGFEGKVEPEPR